MRSPWTGARGRLWKEGDIWRMEVRDSHGRTVWRDYTGYSRARMTEYLDDIAEVTAAVRRVEGMGHKLRTADQIGLYGRP